MVRCGNLRWICPGVTLLDISPVSHLRFDRLLELEGSLATTASQLLRFSHDATERCFLPLAVDKSAVPPKELSLSVCIYYERAIHRLNPTQ